MARAEADPLPFKPRHIHLADALLCQGCNAIVESPAPECPSCCSSQLHPLTRWMQPVSVEEE